MPICLRLFVQDIRAAASRTFWTAGNSRPIRIAMIAMTTSNSIRVKPGRFCRLRTRVMTKPPRRRRVEWENPDSDCADAPALPVDRQHEEMGYHVPPVAEEKQADGAG